MDKITGFIFVILLCGGLSVAVAQSVENTTGDAIDNDTQWTAPLAEEPLSAKQIQIKIDEISANPALTEAERNPLLDTYKAALAQLQEAEHYAAETADYEQQLIDAPLEIDRLRQSLNTAAAPREIQIAANTALQELESRLTSEQAQLVNLQKRLELINQELLLQQARPDQIRNELSTDRSALAGVVNDLRTQQTITDDSRFAHAQRTLLTTRQLLLRNRIEMLEHELQNHDIRQQLLQARSDQVAREIDSSETRIVQLQDIVNDRRRHEATQSLRQSEAVSRQLTDQPEIVSEAADSNAKLSRQLAQLAERIETSSRRQIQLNEQLRQLQESYQSIRRQLEIAGLSDALGSLLRSERRRLPDIRQYQRNAEERDQHIVEARLNQFQIDEQRRKMPPVEDQMRQMLAQYPAIAGNEREQQSIKQLLRPLLEERRPLFDKLSSSYASYVSQLVALDDSERKLTETAGQYAVLLDEKLFWIASSGRIDFDWLQQLQGVASMLIVNAPWQQVLQDLRTAVLNKPLLSIISLLILIWLLRRRQRLRGRLREIADCIGNVSRDYFFLTLEALLITLLLALPLPLLMALAGWSLQTYGGGSEFTGALGNGLIGAAFFGLIALGLLHLCRRHGLGPVHFNWPAKSCRMLLRNLIWYIPLGILAAFMVSATEWASDDLYRDTLGRAAFAFGSLGFSVLLMRLLHPHRGGLGSYLSRRRNLLWHLRFLWYPLTTFFPLALAFLALFGYYYTALQLQSRFFLSIVMLLSALVIASLVLRWLRIEQRRLAWTRARAKREAMLAARARETEAGQSPDVQPVLEAEVLDIETISEQSLGLLKLSTLLATTVALWFIWANLIPALTFLNDWTLWQQSVTTEAGIEITAITLGNGLLAVALLIVLLLVARNLPGLLEIAVLQRFDIDAGNRYAITTIVRYSLTIIGLLVALNTIGIGWDKAQWLVAALGVGLGFGLQEIFANFVSGIIILLERPIRIGDAITINNMDGFVKRIRIRATTITDWDNREIVIPNKTFITGSFINWTLSDQITRIVIPLRVAYGSDTALVQRLLLDIIEKNPTILKEPAPWVLFRRFDDSSLGYEIWVYVRLMSDRLPLIHALHTQIHDTLRAHHIEIPFPQHDLHIRTVPTDETTT
jgi:potassium efflux system protein